MQNNKVGRTDFGRLIGRGWKLYGASLGTAFPVALVCRLLPSLLLAAVLYYGLITMFEPVFRVVQSIVQSLLSYGFDEWAIGSAVEQVLINMESITLGGVLRQLFGSFGVTLLLLIVLVPVEVFCAIALTPVGLGAVMQAQSRMWHGVKMGFKAAFSAAKKNAGRLIVLNLIHALVSAAVCFVTAFLSALAALIPGIGMVLVLTLAVVLMTTVIGARDLMVLIGINEGKWYFMALGEAVKRYFTDWAYVCAGAIFVAGLLMCVTITAVLDVLLMVAAGFPPILTLVCITLALPLGTALHIVIYYDQRRRAGYALPCALE